MKVSSNELRAAGLKATVPRRKILEVMESQGARHMSAEDIYRSLYSSPLRDSEGSPSRGVTHTERSRPACGIGA